MTTRAKTTFMVSILAPSRQTAERHQLAARGKEICILDSGPLSPSFQDTAHVTYFRFFGSRIAASLFVSIR